MSGARVMPPLRPRTGVQGGEVLLALDNGVRLESGGPDPTAPAATDGRGAGHYILLADADGRELGYWNAREWEERPVEVMAEILRTAALGRVPSDVAEARRQAHWNTLTGCRADRDGECFWRGCPQLRDDEPAKSGRGCPLDTETI